MRIFISIVTALAILFGGSASTTAAPSSLSVGAKHYLYSCPGFSYDANSGTYTLPPDCRADPHLSPSTHQWLTDRVPVILSGDGRTSLSNFLNTTVTYGDGTGQTHLAMLKSGVIMADTHLQGCTPFGRGGGWPIGDHMLEPYRHYGVWSYNLSPTDGWQGWLFAGTNGRRTGECANAPRLRTNSAKMADEYFARAEYWWHQGLTGAAMWNLGVALHMVQDASVPSHTHPARDFGSRDFYPAWSNVHKAEFAVSSGGLYTRQLEYRGVRTFDSPGGWVYRMAAEAYPYYPYDAATSALPAAHYGCNVTENPEGCRTQSGHLLRTAQQVGAGFVSNFFAEVHFTKN